MVDIKDNKKENNNTSKQVLLSVLGVAILIVAVVGISFAAFTYTKDGAKENTISTGTITMTYTEGDNGIKIDNAIPMDDEIGKALSTDEEKFDFTVSATITGRTTIDYKVVAVKDSSSTIDDEYIRLYLEKSETNANEGYSGVFGPEKFTASGDSTYGADQKTMEIASGEFSNKGGNGDTKTFNAYYRLRMWVDKDYPLDGISRTYSVKVNVYGKGQD